MAKATPKPLLKATSPITAHASAQHAPKKPTATPKKSKPSGPLAAPVPLVAAVIEASRPIFPIIGIGASAGGLEAIEQFLSGVPANSGMAFVVVQHLDPDHKGMLIELLKRATPMTVQQITERMPVLPNHVYVIPPGFDLSILRGVLYLLEPAEPRGHRLPIDYFLRSLAADQKERSVGVILSGMGSDGLLGLRAIKAQAGAAFVQSTDSAKFDGMPRSVIHAGLADVVAPAEQLVTQIVSYLRHSPLLMTCGDGALEDPDQSGLGKVLILLRAQTGHDFSLYKQSTIYRRIERRMALHQLSKIGDYARYLRTNPQEIDLLFKGLLIGVTSFFRDPAVWEQLKTEVFPSLFALHPDGGTLRAWVPACSTGEEAYTLAMVFREAMDRVRPSVHYSLQIFATDLDNAAIDIARASVYPRSISADVPDALLNRYFVQDNGRYRVGKEVREMVIFASQNMVMDPPFTKIDLLSCRNLLIYLETNLQEKLMPLFHYSLNPGGVLVLGSAETVGTESDLFTPISGKTRLYRRCQTLRSPAFLPLPSAFVGRSVAEPRVGQLLVTRASEPNIPNLQALTESLLLNRFAPVAVLTTTMGDIVYINGKTGHYLEPAAGKVNHNLIAMAREGLAAPLNEAFTRLQRLDEAVELASLTVGNRLVNVHLQPLTEPTALMGLVLVVFTDVPAPSAQTKAPRQAPGSKVHAVQLGLLAHELQTTREEMLTSQEELKSTNQELQSTNEELQSLNEELTTSREEMQSMNEELQTVNYELSSKIIALSQASDDMKNLLNSTDIATLFLDEELRVRRFTTQTTHIFKLIPSDTGRPITDLVSTLDYPALAVNAQEVLRTLVFHEVQVSAKDGRSFIVRTMPYRTQDNHVDGVVITFIENTLVTRALKSQRESQAMLQAAMDCSPAGMAIADAPNGKLRYVNRAGLVIRGEGEERAVNGVDIDRFVSAWQLRDFDGAPLDTDQTPLARAIRHGESSQRSFMIRRPSQEDRSVSASAVPIRDESGVVKAAVIVFEDITERMRVDAVLREALDVLQQRFASQTDELDAAKILEITLNKAQAVLQQRFATQTNELDAAKVLEQTGNKAQAALQQRFASQSTELDAAKVLEKTGNKARAVLEKRFVVQGNALREARSDLQSEKDLHRAPKIRNNSDDTA